MADQQLGEHEEHNEHSRHGCGEDRNRPLPAPGDRDQRDGSAGQAGGPCITGVIATRLPTQARGARRLRRVPGRTVASEPGQ